MTDTALQLEQDLEAKLAKGDLATLHKLMGYAVACLRDRANPRTYSKEEFAVGDKCSIDPYLLRLIVRILERALGFIEPATPAEESTNAPG